MKEIDLEVKVVPRLPNTMNPKRPTPRDRLTQKANIIKVVDQSLIKLVGKLKDRSSKIISSYNN